MKEKDSTTPKKPDAPIVNDHVAMIEDPYGIRTIEIHEAQQISGELELDEDDPAAPAAELAMLLDSTTMSSPSRVLQNRTPPSWCTLAALSPRRSHAAAHAPSLPCRCVRAVLARDPCTVVIDMPRAPFELLR